MRSVLIELIFFALSACGVFIEEPRPLNVTIGHFAEFRCKHTGADFVGWRVNGTSVGRNKFSDFYTSSIVSDGIILHTLTIQALLDYNGTKVDCVAFTINPPGSEFSSNVTLSIQGTLQSVKNPAIEVNSREFKLTWEAPFSLDLTDVDPDIIYCVQMLNITCGTKSVLIDDCNIFEEELNLTSFSQHFVYNLIITPRSNVVGAVNSTAATLEVEFAKYQVIRLNVSFYEVWLGAHVQITLIEETDSDNAFTTLPTSYFVLLVSVDGVGEETMIHELKIDEMAENSVKLSIPGIPRRRLWNYTILAYECTQHPLIDASELSTHDIQNISISSTSPGKVEVSGYLIYHTSVVGLLVMLYTLELSEINTYYFKAPQKNRGSVITASFKGLPGSHYGVSVFVLEESGLPFKRSAVYPSKINVEVGAALMDTEQNIKYITNKTEDNTKVCVECSFLDSDLTDFCVVLIHEKITCETFPCEVGLIDIHTSRKLTRSGSKASGCITGINITDYQVGVIGGKLANPSTVTDLNNDYIYIYTVLLSVSIACATLLFIWIYYCFYLRKKKRFCSTHVQKRNQDPEADECSLSLQHIHRSMELTDSMRIQITSLSDDVHDSLNCEDISTTCRRSGSEDRKQDVESSVDLETIGTQQGQPHSDSDYTASSLIVQELYIFLLPVAPKWEKLGECLSLNQDDLVKFQTNNNTNTDCLKLMLSFYILRTDLQRAWKEILAALLKMGEHDLANEINRRHLNMHTIRDTCLLNAELIPISESSDGRTEQAVLATSTKDFNSMLIEDDDLETGTGPLVYSAQLSYLNKSMLKHHQSDSDSDEVIPSYPIPETMFESSCSRKEYPPFIVLHSVSPCIYVYIHGHDAMMHCKHIRIKFCASTFAWIPSHCEDLIVQSSHNTDNSCYDSELHAIHKVPSGVYSIDNTLCESEGLNKPLHSKSLSSDSFPYTYKKEPVHSEDSVMCENLPKVLCVYKQHDIEQTQESHDLLPFTHMYY